MVLWVIVALRVSRNSISFLSRPINFPQGDIDMRIGEGTIVFNQVFSLRN